MNKKKIFTLSFCFIFLVSLLHVAFADDDGNGGDMGGGDTGNGGDNGGGDWGNGGDPVPPS